MGGEAQAVWRRFVKQDEKLPEGEPRAHQRQFERDARKAWKRYKWIMWWVVNSNPTLPGAPKEPDLPRVEELVDVHNFPEEIKRRFRQSLSEFVTKVETY